MTTAIADLHIHTTVSDGMLTIDALPEAAKEAGLSWVAVTDHDRIHPELSSPITEREGINIIRGIELRVETEKQRLDLLGYGVEPTPELTTELDRLQRDRKNRAQKIIDCVESDVDVDLKLDPHEGIGRPHIARAIDASDAPYTYQEAFDNLIGRDCPCYVERKITSVDEGIELLQEACPIVGLAHPFRYDDIEAALSYTYRLDAVERNYPYGREVDIEKIDRISERNDLLATGGSDAHKTDLGEAGLSQSLFEEFRAQLKS